VAGRVSRMPANFLFVFWLHCCNTSHFLSLNPLMPGTDLVPILAAGLDTSRWSTD